MSELPHCPRCGAALPVDAPAGLCPKCLVQAGFESEVEPEPSASGSDPAVQPTKKSPAGSATGFEPPSPAELGPLFPQLEILELLGKGGMGAVYKARQRGLDRLVAVKVLPPEIGHDAAFAERFTREARALARLAHPHIVAVYDFGQAEGLFYIVMEFVDGANLRQTIQAGGLKPQEALVIVPQICEALQFAHDEGIVHRDIKPENILIDKRGRVKIADFGLAKLVGQDARDQGLTGTHQVMGTLRYMAPEQMQGSREVDHRADIYSLGVVFYELLTGELPMGRFAPPSKKVQVDVRLDEIVLRALEQQPEQRYQHASEIKTDVDAISRSPQPSSAACPETATGMARPVDSDRHSVADKASATQPAGFWILMGLAFWVVSALVQRVPVVPIVFLVGGCICLALELIRFRQTRPANHNLDTSQNDIRDPWRFFKGTAGRGPRIRLLALGAVVLMIIVAPFVRVSPREFSLSASIALLLVSLLTVGGAGISIFEEWRTGRSPMMWKTIRTVLWLVFALCFVSFCGARGSWSGTDSSFTIGIPFPWFEMAAGTSFRMNIILASWEWAIFAVGWLSLLALGKSQNAWLPAGDDPTIARAGDLQVSQSHSGMDHAAVSTSTALNRPKLVPVLATVNLLGALLLMLVTATEEMTTFSESVPRIWQIWGQADAALTFVMSAGLFAASVGLFLWKPWARKVTLGVCILGLASLVFDAPYLARSVLPDFYSDIHEALIAEGVSPDDLDFWSYATFVSLIGGMSLVGLTWLIGQLVYFTRPGVVAAFQAQTESQPRSAVAPPTTAEPQRRIPIAAWIALVPFVILYVAAAAELQQQVDAKIARAVAMGSLCFAAAYLSVYAAIALVRRSRRTADQPSRAEPRPWRIAMFFSLLFFFSSVFVFNWLRNPSSDSASTAPARPTIPGTANGAAAPESSAGWIMGPGGPVLTDTFAQLVLKLRPDQVASVNAALQDAHRDYLALEEQNTARQTDAAGHVITTITPFPGSLSKLENSLWSRLDALLDSEQQSIARLNLRLHAKPVQPPIALSEVVAPGFFGWGEHPVRVELWRVGTWYHWKIDVRGYGDSSQAPQLPEPYRRFWQEPTTDDATTPPNANQSSFPSGETGDRQGRAIVGPTLESSFAANL